MLAASDSPFQCFGLPRTHSVMRHPRTVQRCLDAAVTGPDDIGGNGANKGIKCLCVDGVDNPRADLLRIKPRRCETLGQYSLVARADLRAAHMVRPVARAAGDVR